MSSGMLTEKQEEVLRLRYGQRASIDEIATWLKISRRAVLSRLSNARRRGKEAGIVFPELKAHSATGQKVRLYSASQTGLNAGSGLDEI